MSSTKNSTATYDAIGQAIEAWRASEAYWEAPKPGHKGNYRLKSTGRIAPWSHAVRDMLPPDRLDKLAHQNKGRERRRYALSVAPRETLSHLLFAVSGAMDAAKIASVQTFANTHTAPDVYQDVYKALADMHSRVAEICKDEDFVADLSTLPVWQSEAEDAS